jgi:Fic family protein
MGNFKVDKYPGKSSRQDFQLFALPLNLSCRVEKTATESMVLVSSLKNLMQPFKQTIRTALPKLDSQDLLNNLFKYPYTKIAFPEKDLSVSRSTAIRYLESLAEKGLLKKQKIGRDTFYVNEALLGLLSGK